jgi:hypothetical protein
MHVSIADAKQYVAGSGFTNFVQDADVPAGVIYFQINTEETPGFVYFIPGDQVQRFYDKVAEQPDAE